MIFIQVSNYHIPKNHDTKSLSNNKLKEAGTEFESYFLQTMFKIMRNSIVPKNEFNKKSQAEMLFQEMLDEQYCKNIAKTSNFGLKSYIIKSYEKNSEFSINNIKNS